MGLLNNNMFIHPEAPSLKRIKNDLAKFWILFGDRNRNGVGFDPQVKLQELIRYSYKKYKFKHGKSLAERRASFESQKRFLKFFKKKCFVCQQKGQHRHHIILLKNGGRNNKRNIVTLCRLHHSAIHPWMS